MEEDTNKSDITCTSVILVDLVINAVAYLQETAKNPGERKYRCILEDEL